MSSHRGRILGVAGGGLTDASSASWVANAEVARIGANGEAKTAEILNRLAELEDGVTVLHDVMLPGNSKYRANVDHIVVAGNRVFIIDSKVWKPARYWTVGGKTRRGLKRFEHADKKTMELATRLITDYLSSRNVNHARLETPRLVVWPSSKTGTLSLRFAKVPGAVATDADAFKKWAKKNFTPRRRDLTADPSTVLVLSELLTQASVRPAAQTAALPKAAGGWDALPTPQAVRPTAPTTDTSSSASSPWDLV